MCSIDDNVGVIFANKEQILFRCFKKTKPSSSFKLNHGCSKKDIDDVQDKTELAGINFEKLSWVGDQEKAMVGAGVLIVDFQSSISHFIIFDRKHLSPRKNKNQKAIYLIIRDSNGVFCKLEGLNIKLYKRK